MNSFGERLEICDIFCFSEMRTTSSNEIEDFSGVGELV